MKVIPVDRVAHNDNDLGVGADAMQSSHVVGVPEVVRRCIEGETASWVVDRVPPQQLAILPTSLFVILCGQ
jgi:hypothetical protein